MDKKVTDNDIKKALELCFTDNFGDCEECPLKDKQDFHFSCMRIKQELVLDLLNRKDAKIEELQKENHFKELEIEAFVEMFGECRAGTIKEFAERLKDRFCQTWNYRGEKIKEDIDNLVKEMTNDLKEK